MAMRPNRFVRRQSRLAAVDPELVGQRVVLIGEAVRPGVDGQRQDVRAASICRRRAYGRVIVDALLDLFEGGGEDRSRPRRLSRAGRPGRHAAFDRGSTIGSAALVCIEAAEAHRQIHADRGHIPGVDTRSTPASERPSTIG